MPNPFFNALMGNKSASVAGPQNLIGMAQQFKANPVGFLLQNRLNVPSNIANDPNAILQHLITTGQVNPSRVEAAKQELFKMGGINNYGR